MANLFLIVCALNLLLFRHWAFSSLLFQGEVSVASLEFLMEGLHLLNNITTFSLLSFLDHFLSVENIAPFPNLFLLPVFSVFGVGLEALPWFLYFCRLVTALFLSIWIFEMIKEGVFLKSKAVRSSSSFLFCGLLIEVVLIRANLQSAVVACLLSMCTLYYFRLRSYRDYFQSEKKQVRAFRGFSIGSFLLFLSAPKQAGILVLVFTALELRQARVEQRRKLSEILSTVFGLKKQPVLALFFYVAGTATLLVGFSKGVLAPSFLYLVYLSFAAFFLRCFILYKHSFVDIIHISWNYRQMVYYFLFPLALWMLYPTPNRFERLLSSPKESERVNVKGTDFEAVRETLLPVLADDRRIRVWGIPSTDPKCRVLEFEFRWKYPDWSRNPVPTLCSFETEKLDAQDLEKSFRDGNLRTLLVFYAPRNGIPFEIPLFLRNSKVGFEKVTFPLKAWGLAGAIFYLSGDE